jgi:hypothetical protein
MAYFDELRIVQVGLFGILTSDPEVALATVAINSWGNLDGAHGSANWRIESLVARHGDYAGMGCVCRILAGDGVDDRKVESSYRIKCWERKEKLETSVTCRVCLQRSSKC